MNNTAEILSQNATRLATELRESAVKQELQRLGWLSPEEAEVLRRKAAYYESLGGVPRPNTIDEVDPH